jgi:hypothetical protein
MDASRLENFPEKNLKFILKKMNEKIVYEPRFTNLISNESKKVITEIFDKIGLDKPDNADLTFLYQLYKDNPNYQSEPLEIPKLNTFGIVTKRHAILYVRELWESEVGTYLEDEKDVQSFEEWFGIADWWDGKMIERDYTDEETTDTDIESINKIS